ncbi:MAG: hypothetical protein HC853_04475 [Anaerolineae bacterium]|nr:hypothetical protein [Anaerolineae bacterium]
MLFDEDVNLVDGSMTRRPFQFNADNEDDPEAALQRIREVVDELFEANNQSTNQPITQPRPLLLRHLDLGIG